MYSIGTQTTLTDREWIKGFIAAHDHKGDPTHNTHIFLKDNRYEDDGLDEELEIYADLCKQLKIDF